MAKSFRNDRRFNDEMDYEVQDRKSKKMQRREDKRSGKQLPCEREDR